MSRLMAVPHDAAKTDAPERSLIQAGWIPIQREFDWDFLAQMWSYDAQEIFQRGFRVLNTIASGFGNTNMEWWARLTQLYSAEVQREVENFWDYITPREQMGDQNHAHTLSVEIPVPRSSAYETGISQVFDVLREKVIGQILGLIGTPDKIFQMSLGRLYRYPVQHFQGWEQLLVINQAVAYWSEYDLYLHIDNLGQNRREYRISAPSLHSLIEKTTFDLAVILSGYQSRVGQIQSEYPIASFTRDVQFLSDTLQEGVMEQDRLAVLVHGEPGTGKTVWTQAVAKELLVPLGFVIFILDHAAFENFSPPEFLPRLCIIVNEADNLAQDRASTVAQGRHSTERVLSLMDGTLFNSVLETDRGLPTQKLVVLLTCNTTERLDPAFLREGRIDLIHHFTHLYVTPRT